MRTRRLLAISLSVTLGSGLVGVIGTPAQAYEQRSVSKSGWAYTDSHLPDQSFINPSGDAPIGSWDDADGNKHKFRSHFTFDIARFRGAVIHKADLVIAERSAADCASAQPVELWRTDPITATTSWESSPRRRELLGTIQAGGPATCPGYLVWDIMPALQQLAKQDEQTLTVEIRVPHGYEGKRSHGRKLRPFPALHVEANRAPTVEKIGLEFPSWSCGTRENPQPVGDATTA